MNWMRTLLSSPCQLGLEMVLKYLSLSSYTNQIVNNHLKKRISTLTVSKGSILFLCMYR